MKNSLKKIIIDPEVEHLPNTIRILERIKPLNLEHVENNSLCMNEATDAIKEYKQTLRLCGFLGEVLKPCPGTSHYICCGYHILQIGLNCPLECSYCILQAYLNSPGLRVFANIPERLHEIENSLKQNPNKIYRIGTGEFTDSLALDSIAGWSAILGDFFAKYENTILELKTKTDEIKQLLAMKHRKRIIVSWSINSPFIAGKEEKGAPSILKRLQAARQCQQEGFLIGLHFDPLIDYPDWKAGYCQTVDMLKAFLDPHQIIWISMGCLRFMPDLKPIIRKRHGDSRILDGEFIQGLDGKMRYFKPIRIEMYAYLRELLEQWHPDLGIYLCMESDDIWEKAMGWSPRNNLGLSDYLDQQVRKFYG